MATAVSSSPPEHIKIDVSILKNTMDLAFFDRWDDPITSKQGLYIVQQTGLSPQYSAYYRCGLAGASRRGSDTDISYGGKASSFKSRFAMYRNAWGPTGGRVLAVLHCESRLKHVPLNERRVILQKKDVRDARQSYALASISLVQYREWQFHALLDKHRYVKRAVSARSEWFQTSNPQYLINALRRVPGGLALYVFRENAVLSKRVSTSSTPPDDPEEDYIPVRRSPRLTIR